MPTKSVVCHWRVMFKLVYQPIVQIPRIHQAARRRTKEHHQASLPSSGGHMFVSWNINKFWGLVDIKSSRAEITSRPRFRETQLAVFELAETHIMQIHSSAMWSLRRDWVNLILRRRANLIWTEAQQDGIFLNNSHIWVTFSWNFPKNGDFKREREAGQNSLRSMCASIYILRDTHITSTLGGSNISLTLCAKKSFFTVARAQIKAVRWVLFIKRQQ